MNKVLSFFLLSTLFFLGGCVFFSKSTVDNANTSLQNASASANASASTEAVTSDETDAAAVELGHGYVISLPSGWKVTDRLEESAQNLFVPSADPETTTTIQQIAREGPFDPAVLFNTVTVDASLSPQEVAKFESITCEKPNSSEELNINTLPSYVVTVSSDFCEDGTEISFRKYYTFKKQGSPETLIAIFYTESETEYNQLKDDFDAILDSLTIQDI